MWKGQGLNQSLQTLLRGVIIDMLDGALFDCAYLGGVRSLLISYCEQLGLPSILLEYEARLSRPLMRHLHLFLYEGICYLDLAFGIVLQYTIIKKTMDLICNRVCLLDLLLHLGKLSFELLDGLKLGSQRCLVVLGILLILLDLLLTSTLLRALFQKVGCRAMVRCNHRKEELDAQRSRKIYKHPWQLGQRLWSYYLLDMAFDFSNIRYISGSRLIPSYCSARILVARSAWTS